MAEHSAPAQRVKEDPRPSCLAARENIGKDMAFESGERILAPGGEDTGKRSEESFAPGLEERHEGQSGTEKKRETE